MVCRSVLLALLLGVAAAELTINRPEEDCLNSPITFVNEFAVWPEEYRIQSIADPEASTDKAAVTVMVADDFTVTYHKTFKVRSNVLQLHGPWQGFAGTLWYTVLERSMLTSCMTRRCCRIRGPMKHMSCTNVVPQIQQHSHQAQCQGCLPSTRSAFPRLRHSACPATAPLLTQQCHAVQVFAIPLVSVAADQTTSNGFLVRSSFLQQLVASVSLCLSDVLTTWEVQHV